MSINIENIKIPKKLDHRSSLELSVRLSKIPSCSSVRLELDDDPFATPMGTLLSCSALKRFNERIPPDDFKSNNNYSYLRFCGWPDCPDKERIGKTYLFNKIDFNNAFPIAYREEVEKNAKKLAELICTLYRNDIDPESLYEYLKYSLQEALRNVPEHAGISTVTIAAQRWSKEDYKWLEIAILDEGWGVRASLSQNQKYKLESDDEALREALKPGISGKPILNNPHDNDDWSHSGFGLYMLSNLVTEVGGEFQIVSGESSLTVKQFGKEPPDSAQHNGMAICIRLHDAAVKELAKKFEEIRKRLVKEGEAISNIKASGASRGRGTAPSKAL